MSKREWKIIGICIVALIAILCVRTAFGSEMQVSNPVFEKVEIQRVHDDDAAVTCWVLYAPADKAVCSDSYSISCLPNSVINPKAINKP